ncbi:MAG: YihY/virulence factor BrkB family protein [Acidobacteria bacterium]|nr:MAG: YihY/virulence factor BrkB family protein [Acidobacteriota bacterium]
MAPNLTGREVAPMSRLGAIHWMKPGLSAVSTVSANIRGVWALLKESGFAWLQDNAPSMGAALTFYAILSLAPVLIVATAIAALGLGQKAAEAEVLRHLQALVGETSARLLQAAILSANGRVPGLIATTIGVGTMLVGASGAFVELQDALNKIWRVERKSGSFLLHAIRQRFLSFSLVLGTGVLLLLSLVASAALGGVGRSMGHLLTWRVFILESVLSFGVITLLLALVFKLLPDTKIAWNDVWIGAAIASLLFTTGKVLIGLYLSRSVVTSAYGAVSSPLVVLVWIYYSAQILLLGAEITHVYTNKHGSLSKRRPA